MQLPSLDELKSSAQYVAEQIPYLKLLVIFGSRATGRDHTGSDWDFAVLYDEKLRRMYEQEGWSELRIWAILENAFELSEDKIDVVELNHCSPLMGFLIARDGKLLYEKEPNEFTRFRCKAWKIYADTAKFRKARRRSIELTLQNWGV